MIKFIKSRLNKKGFTLVELLIVIAVLGIIAGIGINSMTGVTGTFKKKADEETGRILARQVEVLVLAGEIKTDGTITDKVKNIPTPQTDDTKTFIIAVEGLEDTTDKATVTISTGTDAADFSKTYTIEDDAIK